MELTLTPLGVAVAAVFALFFAIGIYAVWRLYRHAQRSNDIIHRYFD